MATVETGLFTSNMLPMSYRVYYEAVLLDVLRAQTIFAGFARPVVDFDARDAKQITFSEVYDLHPAIGTLTEGVPFVEGAYLDGKQTTIDISEHGNVVKTNKFHNVTQFWNSGDFEGLVREKLGRNLVESLEIMARNELITSTYLRYSEAGAGATPTTRATVAADDIMDPEFADRSRTLLMSRNALGLNDGANSIAAVVHPKQAYDIRNAAASDWKEVMEYAQPGQILRGEVGMVHGVRYVLNNFCLLENAGATVGQGQLDAASVKGQGGPDSDDASLLNYVTLGTGEGASFSVGDRVTIHKQALGTAVLETDETAETREIIQISTDNIYFDQSLFVAHAATDYVTNARDLYAAVVIGGPGLVWGVGALPNVIVPPIIDDFGRINRVSWYGIFDYHLLRDVYTEVWLSAATI